MRRLAYLLWVVSGPLLWWAYQAYTPAGQARALVEHLVSPHSSSVFYQETPGGQRHVWVLVDGLPPGAPVQEGLRSLLQLETPRGDSLEVRDSGVPARNVGVDMALQCLVAWAVLLWLDPWRRLRQRCGRGGVGPALARIGVGLLIGALPLLAWGVQVGQLPLLPFCYAFLLVVGGRLGARPAPPPTDALCSAPPPARRLPPWFFVLACALLAPFAGYELTCCLAHASTHPVARAFTCVGPTRFAAWRDGRGSLVVLDHDPAPAEMRVRRLLQEDAPQARN